MSSDLTARVSRFVAETQLEVVPAEVIALAKHSILDGFGLAVAGSRTDAARIVAAEIDSYRCADRSSAVLGTATRLPPRFAAFLNGLAIHADDFDDTQLAVLPDRVYGLLTHPTAPVLPAVLAVAEERGLSGSEALLAYLLGVEVESAVAESIDPRHYETGFHSTGTAGTIGAAAAVARLLRLDAERTRTALGLAASQASGLRENFGTMTKPFHAGHAAEGGVLAARLVAAGFTAAQNILEADRGFFRAAGGGFDPAKVGEHLADPWTFATPGVSIKPFPSGSLTHPAMTAFSDLMRAHRLRADDVAEVRVGTNRHMPNALIHHRPNDHLAAKFSMEFCIAILLLRGRAGLPEFRDEVVRDPEVRATIEKVRFEVDPEADAAGYNNMTSIIRVRLNDGREVEGRAAFAKGSPANPMTGEELEEKFLGCLDAGGVDRDAGARAAELILALEDQPDLGAITALLGAATETDAAAGVAEAAEAAVRS
ncbi:MAG TPA: MmgE/PrpD family protein [Solirubrobacteraceae bacterium]|jgi:2-methylcitrate dehydratase PrpD|nr:MmgE/PrpD family protein [Solirubrobacteraceae bacterium]